MWRMLRVEKIRGKSWKNQSSKPRAWTAVVQSYMHAGGLGSGGGAGVESSR